MEKTLCCIELVYEAKKLIFIYPLNELNAALNVGLLWHSAIWTRNHNRSEAILPVQEPWESHGDFLFHVIKKNLNYTEMMDLVSRQQRSDKYLCSIFNKYG